MLTIDNNSILRYLNIQIKISNNNNTNGIGGWGNVNRVQCLDFLALTDMCYEF